MLQGALGRKRKHEPKNLYRKAVELSCLFIEARGGVSTVDASSLLVKFLEKGPILPQVFDIVQHFLPHPPLLYWVGEQD